MGNTHPLGKVVNPSLRSWKTAFQRQMSKEWVNLLNPVQLDAIYQELYSLATYLLALNARRRENKTCVSKAIRVTVRNPCRPFKFFRIMNHTDYNHSGMDWQINSCL